MNLLINKDIFEYYFREIVDKVVMNTTERCIADIFYNITDNNNENSIVLSNHLVTLIEQSIGDDTLFKEYITHLITEDSYINIRSGSTLNDYDTELLYLNSNLQNPKSILSFNRYSTLTSIQELAICQERKKPNNHWASFILAKDSKLTLRYYDFTSNAELNKFFNYMFSLSSNNQFMILDRNCNFEGDMFSALKKVKKKIFYYTYAKTKVEKIDIHDAANKFFGGGVKVYTTSDKSVIHERRIIFDNFVIDIDDDFWSISVKRHTWKIDFTLCKSTVQSLQTKRALFTEFIK